MLSEFILNAFFPPQCPVCRKRIRSAGLLCEECFCGLYFVCDHMPGQVSAVVYNEVSKKLLLAFKYGDKTELALLMAKMMIQADQDIFDEIDFLTGVPIHWTRMLARKYNQAILLARAVSKIRCIPVYPDILKRTKATLKQGNGVQRFENVKNAFSFNARYKIAGKKVLLIDDVVTTGATAQCCAKILIQNGAKEVRLLTFAKAVRK